MFPHGEYRVRFIFYPLLPGRVPLPSLRLQSTAIEKIQNVSELLDRLLPSHMTVLPKKKGGTAGTADDAAPAADDFSVTEPVVVKNEPFSPSTRFRKIQTWAGPSLGEAAN